MVLSHGGIACCVLEQWAAVAEVLSDGYEEELRSASDALHVKSARILAKAPSPLAIP